MACSRLGVEQTKLEKGERNEVIERETPRHGEWRGVSEDPAVTYSRPRRTTIGPGRLTAVFGMGTGVAVRVCSPGSLRRSPGGTPRCINWQRRVVAVTSRAGALGGGRGQCGEAFGC